jgi:hypothetical protein
MAGDFLLVAVTQAVGSIVIATGLGASRDESDCGRSSVLPSHPLQSTLIMLSIKNYDGSGLLYEFF